MFRLGLTGSIATGKTTTLKAFADLGIPVFSSDDAVHALYKAANEGTAATLPAGSSITARWSSRKRASA